MPIPTACSKCLINLVDNAIKFTPTDGAVMVQACRVEADPGSVYISVSDTGRGISPEAKALIFERLYQDADSVDNNRSGLGLGLFICREIVRLHEGRIWVSSEPGQGSTFTFTLPVYSLAKLLAPVVTHNDRLRPAFVLVRVELTPFSAPPRGNWKETWQQCSGDPAALRLSRQRPGFAADGDIRRSGDFLRRGLDRHAASRES